MSKQKSITNRIYCISWLTGSWKTLLASIISMRYMRIYSNIEFIKNKKIVSNTADSISQIQAIPFHDTKGILIQDEAGINMNARRSMSSENQEFNKMLALSRKANLDVIMIWQDLHMIDKTQKALSYGIFYCESYYCDDKRRLMFDITAYRNRKGNLSYVWQSELDLIAIADRRNVTYNTLTRSEFKKTNKPPSPLRKRLQSTK